MAQIMIIEDNEVHNTLLCHSIEDLGHKPMPFDDVESAKKMLKEQLPDLFIIDIHIKDSKRSTLALINELTTSKHYKHVPIIIVSAYATKEEIKKELPKFNTDNVIEKPFNVDAVSAKVKSFLKGKK